MYRVSMLHRSVRFGVVGGGYTLRPTTPAGSPLYQRRFATEQFLKHVASVRNIGISAHIDSGKTTLTERVLFYTGRIQKIHEVKGGGEVGATMDSMELEKERGITIRSAATFCRWGENNINLIDTPGHVDFTIEVERALRVLDGAVLLLCGVGGVQSQTLTVDRQMKRYGVPRICFINKLDRDNANPERALKQAIEKLGINAAFLQLPIGISHEFSGVIDVITNKAIYFDGPYGETLRYEEVPSYMQEDVVNARKELIARLGEVDEVMEEIFLEERDATEQELYDAVRRTTIANKFVGVMMGSAYKNKGVQLLLDAVVRYLPNPTECTNMARQVNYVTDEDGLKQAEMGEPMKLECDDEKPLVCIDFKLEQNNNKKVGLANFLRIYQGKLRKGDQMINIRTGRQFTAQKLVRMHSNAAEEVNEVRCGEICALLGDIGASSGDTLMKNLPPAVMGPKLSCENMYIPPRVISKKVKPMRGTSSSDIMARFKEFMREDPTFNAFENPETKEIVIEGMGELHLDIYVERIKREDHLNAETGKPTVNYREVIMEKKEFDFTHKRQSGGQGQYALLRGTIEPYDIDMSKETGTKNTVVLKCPNGEIREALQKSFKKAMETKIFPKGSLLGAPLWGVKVTLQGGAMHEVDSTDIAFRNATTEMWAHMLPQLTPTLVEPYMSVEIVGPKDNMTNVVNEFAKREGVVLQSRIDGPDFIVEGEAALDTMFGFIVSLRSMTKGLGDYSMEFKEYRPMPQYKAQLAINERSQELGTQPYKL